MVVATQLMDFARNKIDMHSFTGKVNFIMRFNLNLEEMITNNTNMLKKDDDVK